MQKSNIQQNNAWLVAESLTFTPHSQFAVKIFCLGQKLLQKMRPDDASLVLLKNKG